MGNSQSTSETKDNYFVAQANVGQMDSKINMVGIILIAVLALLALIIIYKLRNQCRKTARKWLQREIRVVNTHTPPVIRVETMQSTTDSSHTTATKPKVIYT